MFQVLPSDLLGWLHSLHVHLNMSDQLTASTVYVCIKYDIQIRTCASCIQANCLCLHHQTGCGKDSLQHWRPLVPDQFVQLSAKHKYWLACAYLQSPKDGKVLFIDVVSSTPPVHSSWRSLHVATLLIGYTDISAPFPFYLLSVPESYLCSHLHQKWSLVRCHVIPHACKCSAFLPLGMAEGLNNILHRIAWWHTLEYAWWCTKFWLALLAKGKVILSDLLMVDWRSGPNLPPSILVM